MPRETLSLYHPDRKEAKPKSETAWIYPGQGTQFVGMGLELHNVTEFASKTYKRSDRILGLPISQTSFYGPEDELDQTINAQPAIFIFNFICDALLRRQGIVSSNKKMVAGHSLGEYNALVAAGAMTFKQGLWLVGQRAEAMSKACQISPGGMIAVPLRETDERLDIMKSFGMQVSIVNSHEQTVLSGTQDNINRTMEWMEAEGIKGARLKVEGGFHSSLMKPAVEDFSKALANVNIKSAKIPIVANTTAALMQTPQEIRKELIDQLTHPVLWKDSLVLMTRNRIGQTIEIGEKGILSNMNLKVNGGKIERLKESIKGVAINFVVWQRQPQAAPSPA